MCGIAVGLGSGTEGGITSGVGSAQIEGHPCVDTLDWASSTLAITVDSVIGVGIGVVVFGTVGVGSEAEAIVVGGDSATIFVGTTVPTLTSWTLSLAQAVNPTITKAIPIATRRFISPHDC